jgi:hypothetical protein
MVQFLGARQVYQLEQQQLFHPWQAMVMTSHIAYKMRLQNISFLLERNTQQMSYLYTTKTGQARQKDLTHAHCP